MVNDDMQGSRKDVSLSEKIRTGMINQNDIHEELSSEFATLGERKKAMIDLYRSTKKEGNDEKLQP
ncbi:hypothetical protein [Sporosarcina sp. JAI121]|uniref:hypothetical protein n=1 Tax=Sporosarcina sp. JAI121 TaxID=2723064 RepID=UPI0015C6EF12|nr:hypothetical protein [Sporosarcina sp. JAI121]NYF26333.1 hypothetical protein [Sporosarcina sp. JAI121]